MRMQTKHPVTFQNWRGYGPITVPAGVAVTHQTACGVDKNYHFVNEFGWIKEQYPDVARLMVHDAAHYGIDIPAEHVEHIDEEGGSK